MARKVEDGHGTRLRSERGISLIHVAVAIFVLMGFSAFVLDHGVLMLARAQAQNAADAAAIAAVTTRVKDEPGDTPPPANSMSEKVLVKTVDQHHIIGGSTTAKMWNWTCPTGVAGWCARVDVVRDGTNGSDAVPVYFATLFGITQQKIRATATAVAAAANGTRCMKPWLIPDKWSEVQPPGDEYNPPTDIYTPYDYVTKTPGTGYGLVNIGTTVLIKPGNPAAAISPSDYYEVGDATTYEEAITGCLITKKIGDTIDVLPGNRKGPTKSGVETLTADGPVDVIVGLFSPAEFESLDRKSGSFSLTIVNMMSVRLTGVEANGTVHGVITGGVGEDLGTGPTPTGAGALFWKIQLVR